MPSGAAAAGLPPTCRLLGWRVFQDGYHKGQLYPPAAIDEIAENFRRLKGHLTPKAGLGHDKEQRLASSLGLPNVGLVSDVRSDGQGNLDLDVANVPTWLGGMINADRYNDGSIELKQGFPDPDDPAKTMPGSVLDGVAILGEEQPAVKGCPPPRATFEDGTEVPPNHDPLPVPAEAMSMFSAGATGPPDKVLCFSDSLEVGPVDELIAKYQALAPDQQQEFLKQCGGAVDANPDVPPPPPVEPVVPPPPPVDPPGNGNGDDKFAALMSEFKAFATDMSTRVGGLEKAYSDGAKKDEEATMTAFSASVADKCKGLTRKLAPHLIKTVVEPTALGILKSTNFSSAGDKKKAFSDYFAGFEALPDNPMLKDAIADGKKGGDPATLSAGGLSVLSHMKVTSPRVVERLTAAPTN